MTKEHILPFSKAFFDLNREIGPVALMQLIESVAPDADCETDSEFEFLSVQFESNVGTDNLRIYIRFTESREVYAIEIEIDNDHASALLDAIYARLSDIYMNDRTLTHLKQYYVANLASQLGL